MLNKKDIIIDVVDEIMTDMFFIFPDLDDDGKQITEGETKEDAIHVGIHFNTDFYIHFDIDRELLREMAINFLAIEPEEVDDEQLAHMACETANIIGGNYLVKVDPDHNFKLSIPEVMTSNEADMLEEGHWEVSFVSDGRVMKISPFQRAEPNAN